MTAAAATATLGWRRRCAWGLRAIELGERPGDVETLAHALTSVRAARLKEGAADGIATLERSVEVAKHAGLHEPSCVR